MSTEKATILIYDDEPERARDFEGKLEKGLGKADQSNNFDVVSLDTGEFQSAIKTLEQRRIDFRNGEIDLENIPKDDEEKIDNASIFVIDYDLLPTQKAEAEKEDEKENIFTGSLTGEIVAYLVRCFSKCKLIVGLNQYGSNPFDLTLRGDLDSFADLNLGEEQLDNPNLWTDGSWQEYRPWSWPNLSDSIQTFDKRIEEVQQKLNKPICEVLGFSPETFQLLPREIVQFIGKYEEKEPCQTTFREFVTKSGNGLKPKDVKELDNNINDHVLARVGAARISKWLDQLVLPEQDILVDAPHLVSRYPSLIRGNEEEIETWNETSQLIDFSELGMKTDLIGPYRFQKSYWVSRPVWFWDELCECEEIQEVSEPWLTIRPNWVFCEDTSCFHKQEDCKEFLADIASPFTRRFVKNISGVDYQPRVRFSL